MAYINRTPRLTPAVDALELLAPHEPDVDRGLLQHGNSRLVLQVDATTSARGQFCHGQSLSI